MLSPNPGNIAGLAGAAEALGVAMVALAAILAVALGVPYVGRLVRDYHRNRRRAGGTRDRPRVPGVSPTPTSRESSARSPVTMQRPSRSWMVTSTWKSSAGWVRRCLVTGRA